MNSVLNLIDIAGFCPEEAVWKMITDVCEFLSKDPSVSFLSPRTIVVDGETFLVEAGDKPNEYYLAPEQLNGNQRSTQEQLVWQIGAVAFFMATGHLPFGGHGSRYQREHPHVTLPVLPKAFQSLSPIVQRCMYTNPSKRITMEELKKVAHNGLLVCSQRQRSKVTQQNKSIETKKYQKEKWPEKMIEV